MVLDQDQSVGAFGGSPSAMLRNVLDETEYAWEDFTWMVDMPEGVRTITIDDLFAYCDTLTVEQVSGSFRMPTIMVQTEDPEREIKKALLSLVRAAADHGFGFIGLPHAPEEASEEGEEEPPAQAEKRTCAICGQKFIGYPGGSAFCSSACAQKGEMQKQVLVSVPPGASLPGARKCEVCGKSLPKGTGTLVRFCSQACYDSYYATHVNANRANPVSNDASMPHAQVLVTGAQDVDTAGSFMERRKAKRETRHEKLQKMVFGEPKIGAPEDGMPESTYASEILRDTLEEVGIPEDKYRWIIPLPGVSRTVKVSDLGDYCDTLPEEKVIEACKVPEEWSTDDPVTEMVGRLYTLAEAAAKAGFGDVHVPLGEDGQPIPPEPGPFEVGKKYETIGKEVGKKYEVAGELGEKIGKDIGKKYETIGRDIGKKYEKIGDTGKKITKKVEGYGKGIGKDMERKIKQMNKKYETIGDKFKKFGNLVTPEIPTSEASVLVTRNRSPPPPDELQRTKTCRACGKEFTTAFATVIYCSEFCRKLALRDTEGTRSESNPYRRSCEVCGKEIPPGSPRTRRFCSDTCHDVYFSTHVRTVEVNTLKPCTCPACNTLLSDIRRGRCPVCGAKL